MSFSALFAGTLKLVTNKRRYHLEATRAATHDTDTYDGAEYEAMRSGRNKIMGGLQWRWQIV
jgi:hypothetical protein